MLHTFRSSKTLTVALLYLAAVILIVLPALASTGDYGVNTGGNSQNNHATDVPHPTQQAPPTNTPVPPTNTPVPPTATPSGPTPTPTCIDGQWGQEPNGAWVCIPNSELTQQAGG